MKRNILFICTDQQRYDSLGCNGGQIARTPVLDRLAATGLNYRRAHNQNVICMPSRATMITGQLVRSHGVYASGIQLPEDAPNVIPYMADAGYRVGLFGKAHFDPIFEETPPIFHENRLALEYSTGPWRGFEHAELAGHLPAYAGNVTQHYGVWLRDNYPDDFALWPRRHFDAERLSSDTGAPIPARAVRSRASATTLIGSRIGRSRGSARSTPTTRGSPTSASPIRTIR